MDVFGFAFATAFLVAAFTGFAILGRLMDTVSAGIGSTVAPTMVSGFRAWTPSADRAPAAEDHEGPGDDGLDGRGAGTGTDAGRRPDPGLMVPVTRLTGRHPRWLQAGDAAGAG
jgi:hypothetical protein